MSDYFFIITKKASAASGLAPGPAVRRVLNSWERRRYVPVSDGQQAMSIVPDGAVEWSVVVTDKTAPNGVGRCAFVINARRYRPSFRSKDS